MATIKRADLDAGRVDLGDVATGRRLAPLHPGVHLAEMIRALGVTPYRVAKDAGMPLTRLAAILKGERAITADTSIRLGRLFGQSDGYWLRAQTAYEVARAEAADAGYDAIRPLAEAGR